MQKKTKTLLYMLSLFFLFYNFFKVFIFSI